MQRHKVNKAAMFFIIVFIMFSAYTFRLILYKFSVSPHYICFNNILKEIDERFSVDLEFNDDGLIDRIYITGTDYVYSDPDILLKVDTVQKSFYSYFVENRKAFKYYKKSRFFVYFVGKSFWIDNRPGSIKFDFAAVEGGEYDYSGFNHMFISGRYLSSDIYSLSNMFYFKNFRVIRLENIEIDSTDILEDMKNLKEIVLLDAVTGDVEGLEKKAKELGIRVIYEDELEAPQGENEEEDDENEDEETEVELRMEYDSELDIGIPAEWQR